MEAEGSSHTLPLGCGITLTLHCTSTLLHNASAKPSVDVCRGHLGARFNASPRHIWKHRFLYFWAPSASAHLCAHACEPWTFAAAARTSLPYPFTRQTHTPQTNLPMRCRIICHGGAFCAASPTHGIRSAALGGTLHYHGLGRPACVIRAILVGSISVAIYGGFEILPRRFFSTPPKFMRALP